MVKTVLLAAAALAVASSLADDVTSAGKPTAELKAECVRYARENGFADFADELEAQDDLTTWIDGTIRFCEGRLKACEDVSAFDCGRQRVLRLLDYPLHVDNCFPQMPKDEARAYERAAVDYVRRAVRRVLEEVKSTAVAQGSLRAWHVYNMAYVLKGPQHTVLIDFTPYPHFEGCETWTDADWQAFAEIGDVLAVTHPHRDHTSYPLMERMRTLGKPLVLPCAMTNRLTGVRYEAGDDVHVLSSDHAEPVDIGGVKFWNFMGFQGGVPCNTYLIEIDDVRVADNGDNSPKEREWNLVKCPPADVIISSSWSLVTNIVSACAATPGFNRDTAVFLPSHENELMHSVPHRESYQRLYGRTDRLGCPGFIWPRTAALAFGESTVFNRTEKKQ